MNDGERLVAGDALQAAGDPLGELVAVQAALESSPDDEALLMRQYELRRANEERWFGPRASEMRRDAKVDFEWRLGFVDAVTLRTMDPSILEGVFRSPAMRFLRKLKIDLRDAGDGALALPEVPTLEELEILPGKQTHGLFASLQNAYWPRLQKLTLANVAVNTLPRLDALRDLALPRLINADSVRNLKCLEQIERLDLSHGTLRELKEPARFLHLRKLRLHDNWLSDSQGEILRASFGDRLELGIQQDPFLRQERSQRFGDILARALEEERYELVHEHLTTLEAVPYLLARLWVAEPPESHWIRSALEEIGPAAGPEASTLLVFRSAHDALISVDPDRARGLALHRRRETLGRFCAVVHKNGPVALARHLRELLEDDDPTVLRLALEHVATEPRELVPRYAVRMHLSHRDDLVREAAEAVMKALDG